MSHREVGEGSNGRRGTTLGSLGSLALAVACAVSFGVSPGAQQTAVFGTVGIGISHTSKGEDPGVPVLGPGVGGTATALAADAGVWFTRRFGIGGELSMGLPFTVEQVEGGVGLCCSSLTRDHQLTYLSGVAKVYLDPGIVFLGGLSWGRVATDEVRVFTPIGSSPRAPVESEFSRSRGAWVVGAEGEIRLTRALQLVPAARWYVNFPEDEIAGLNPLALGNTTLRVTVSLRGTSGR